MQKLLVQQDGSIKLEGRKYLSRELLPFMGEAVKAFVDDSIGGAGAVCFSLDGEFITNAQNPELWAEMTRDVLKSA